MPTPPPQPGDLTQAEIALLRDVALDLADAARQFALILVDRAKLAQSDDDAIRLAASFERVSRAARRAVLLARHTAKPAPARKPGAPEPTPESTQTHPAPAPETNYPEPRAPGPREPADREAAITRLDALDHDPAIANSPLQPIIDAIKADLRQVFEQLSKPLYRPKTPRPQHQAEDTPEDDPDDEPDLDDLDDLEDPAPD